MAVQTSLPEIISLQDKHYYVFPRIYPTKRIFCLYADSAENTSNPAQTPAPCSMFFPKDTDHFVSLIREYLDEDDVFCEAFPEHIFIGLNDINTTLVELKGKFQLHGDEEYLKWLKALGTRTISLISRSESSTLRPGPYFLGDGLSQAWRCYPDPLTAFVRPIVPSRNSNTFEDPGIQLYPVPLRIFSGRRSALMPLAALRFAIKDVIDVEGVPTTNCCCAYEQLYGRATYTAPSVQKLIDKGAIPVAKARTVQFASGSHPMDWVDWQCSFNPRGDDYQSSSMSSAGSAVAVAGYDWVDFSIGTDTFGSVIMPAAACGIYGFRPTKGIQDLTGIIPVSAHLDTAGFFTRSISLATKLAKEWLGNDVPHDLPEQSTKIIYPADLFPFENKEYQDVVERFVALMEEFLGVKAYRLNLSSRWDASKYGDGRPLDQYLESTIPSIQLRDCFNNSEDFRRSYSAKFGKKPYVDPVIRYNWDLSHIIIDEQYEQGKIEKATFEDWISKEIVPPGSKSVLLLPAGVDSPTYRDRYYGTVEESGR